MSNSSNNGKSDAPFSKAADNNKAVILEQLKSCLDAGSRVLEIASGTGQHALHFAAEFPEIIWQPTDVDLDTYALRQQLAGHELPNLETPFVLDIDHWPNLRPKYDAVFSANCLHIVAEEKLTPYVNGASSSLRAGGKMLLYGPFKYGGEFTTPSNAEFDRFLRQNYPGSGIRDFEQINLLAQQAGLEFVQDIAMPANNQFLIWQKKALR